MPPRGFGGEKFCYRTDCRDEFCYTLPSTQNSSTGDRIWVARVLPSKKKAPVRTKFGTRTRSLRATQKRLHRTVNHCAQHTHTQTNCHGLKNALGPIIYGQICNKSCRLAVHVPSSLSSIRVPTIGRTQIWREKLQHLEQQAVQGAAPFLRALLEAKINGK